MTDTNNQQANPHFEAIRVYSKDCSLETPNTPAIFQKQWKPELKVEFDTKASSLGSDQYEVVLRITVTCENDGATAFVCEVNQAGIFVARNFEPEVLDYVLGATAPNMLYPYAREHISSLVSRATFPQLTLAPLSFEAIYRAKQEQLKQQQEAQDQQANA